jgi:hypothetical protein
VPRIPPHIDPELNDTSARRSLPSIRDDNASRALARGMASDRTTSLNDFYRSATEASATPPSDIATRQSAGVTATDGYRSSSDLRNDATRAISPLPADIRPLPNLDAPETTSGQAEIDAPPLLNDPRDRTASPVQPIPTRWASNRITWPTQQADYQHETDDSGRGQAATVSGAAPRRLDPRRIQTQRFRSDDSRRQPALQEGWRSARR